jgi:hypothetical protein
MLSSTPSVFSIATSLGTARLGPELLSEIAEVTGGRSFTLDNPSEIPMPPNESGSNYGTNTWSGIAQRIPLTTVSGAR